MRIKANDNMDNYSNGLILNKLKLDQQVQQTSETAWLRFTKPPSI